MKVLLYNLSENIKLKQLLSLLNITYIDVDKKDYGKKLSSLLNDIEEINNDNKDFNDEMMILSDFRDEQLDTLLKLLRSSNIYIPLKAIITPININWNSYMIRNELIKENILMRKK